MQHARKNSIPKRFLRRSSSGGKSGSGNNVTKSDGFDTPAVAADHQNYYQQHHHDHHDMARTSKSSTQTAPPGRELPAFRALTYGNNTSTPRRPPAKITGIRRPGPRHQVAAPVIATQHQKQTERSPGSTRVNFTRTDHQERRAGRGSPAEGNRRRRNPREVSPLPPNFSRKTTPSPEMDRGRSSSKTGGVPSPIRGAVKPDDSLDDGVYILQAKTYTPPSQTTTATTTTTVVTATQPQTSYFSPSTESESGGSSTGDSVLTASSSMGQSFPSPLSTPSHSPVVAHRRSSNLMKHGSSNSNVCIENNPRERCAKPSLTSSLEKELPLLPASVYKPTAPEKPEAREQKKNLPIGYREPTTRKQEQKQQSRRAVDPAVPPKQFPSLALNLAPPVRPVLSHPKQEVKVHPAAVAVSDTSTSGPKDMGNLYNRRQKTGPGGDPTAALSTAIRANILAASIIRVPPRANNSNAIPIPTEKRPTPPVSPASLAARIGLQPLHTQRAKEGTLRSHSSSRHRDCHGKLSTLSQSARSREASDLSECEFLFLELSPKNTTLVPVSPLSVSIRRKQGNEARRAPKAEEEDREMQRFMQELDHDFRCLAVAGTPQHTPKSGSGSGYAAIGTKAAVTTDDTKTPSRLPPLSPEEQRRSVCVAHLNLRKESKKSPRSEPSPSRGVTDNAMRPRGGGASSTTSRQNTPTPPPPSRNMGDQRRISTFGQGSPSKGGRDEGNRFNALKRRDEFVKYHGGFF